MARSHGSAMSAVVVREGGEIASITYGGEFFSADVAGDELVKILTRIAGDSSEEAAKTMVNALGSLSVLLRPELDVAAMGQHFEVPFPVALKFVAFLDAVRGAIAIDDNCDTAPQQVQQV